MLKKSLGKLILKDPQFLIDSMGDGILIVDTKGIITLANKEAVRMLGWKKNDLVGTFSLEPFGALDEEGNLITKKNAALMDAISHGTKTTNATRQFTKKNGEKFWSSITVTPITKGKTKHGAIIVFRDITEQRMNQEYQTDFARVASHQLRSPLGNLRWAVESVLHEKLGPLNDVQKDTLGDVFTTLSEMNAMVNDLMHVSRLQTHRLRKKKEKTSVEEVLTRVLKDLEHYASANNVSLKVVGAAKKPRMVTMGALHLRTVLQNVIENAIRYGENGTEITVEIKNRKAHVDVNCTNHGIGIPEKAKPFIFSKFYRAKNAVQKQGDGTGLGMYITHELVKLYGGDISFESTPLKTTTFYISLRNDVWQGKSHPTSQSSLLKIRQQP